MRLHEIGGRGGGVGLMATLVVGVVVGCSGCSRFEEKSRMKVGKENRSQHTTAKGR